MSYHWSINSWLLMSYHWSIKGVHLRSLRWGRGWRGHRTRSCSSRSHSRSHTVYRLHSPQLLDSLTPAPLLAAWWSTDSPWTCTGLSAGPGMLVLDTVSLLGWVIKTFFGISNLHIGQMMYFGVKLRTFQGFFILVWFGVGQVQKTEFSLIWKHWSSLWMEV